MGSIDLHDQPRRASSVACRSINAQAAFRIKIGMLCELREAGVQYSAAGDAK